MLHLVADSDGDGYGSSSDRSPPAAPDGYGTGSDDRNDDDAEVYPGALEEVRTTSTKLDGSVGDEDVDDDGVAACDDCDDNDASVSIHPIGTRQRRRWIRRQHNELVGEAPLGRRQQR